MSDQDTIGLELKVTGAERADRLLKRFEKSQERIEKAISKSSTTLQKEAAKAEKALEKQAKAAEKAAEKAARAADKERKAQEALKKADPLNLKRFLGGNQKLAEGVTSQLESMGQSMLSQIPIIGQFSGALGGVAGGALAAAGALAILAVGIAAGIGLWAKLGTAGIRAQDTLNAFGNQVAAIGEPTGVLANLRKQTRGTVDDLELMRLSVQALRGTDATFRQIVGDQLGTVIDSTTRIARATGENSEIIREKFLSGLRLQSKLKLDDVGVTLDAEKAYEAYAKEIGKSASALTDLEKRAAVAQDAIRQLSEIAEGFNINKGADALERIQVSIRNIFTRGSLIAKESFEPVIVGIADIIGKIEQFHARIAPILREVSRAFIEVGHAVFAAGKFIVGLTVGPYFKILREAFPYIAATAILAARAIKTFARLVQAAFSALGNVFAPFQKKFDTNIKHFVARAAITLAFGGAFIIGAFAGGIMRGGTAVLKAVTFIAKIVADFLQGFSPPKKGPLSKIDQGGYNVALAWAQGFTDGLMGSTFESALAFVDARLGDIGKMSLEQVEARLLQLDLAIRPFQESLDIVKADMEAIAGFVDPALKVAERQRDKAIKAFNLGQGGDINQLRLFDKRIDQLNQVNELAQEQVDKAELSLAFAKMQQAQERALLNIQKNRLGKPADGSDTAPETSGGEVPTEDGEGAPFIPGAPPDLVGGLGADVEAAIAAITGAANAGWRAGLGNAEQGLEDARAGLLEQTKRINEANPVASLTKRLSGVRGALTGPFDAAKKELDKIIPDIFGENGLIGRFLGVGSTFTNILGDGGSFRAAFDGALTYLSGTFKPSFSTQLDDIFGPLGRMGQRIGTTSTFFLSLTGEGGSFKTAFKTANTWLGGDYKSDISSTLDGIFGGADSTFNTALGVSSAFYDTLTGDSGAFKTAWDGANTYLTDKFEPAFELNMLNLFGLENSVMFGATYNASELIGRIGLSWKGLLDYLNTQGVPQFGSAFGRIIGIITGPINAIVGLINTIKNAAEEALGKLNDIASVGGNAGSVGNAIIGGVEGATGINLPFGGRKAKGGLNLPPAVYEVGERGREYVMTGGQTNIFPNRFVRALETLVTMVSAAPSPSMGSITNNQTTNNVGGTTIQVRDTREAALVQRQLMAGYGASR